MSSRGRSTTSSASTYMEIKDGDQAHGAILQLCDDALAEAELLLTEMRPAAVTPTFAVSPYAKQSGPPSPPPPATLRKSPAISGSPTTDGDGIDTSHSYYDLSFSRHRGKVFYSKDNTLKLIAFDRNGELSAGKDSRHGRKMAPNFETPKKSSGPSKKMPKVDGTPDRKTEDKDFLPVSSPTGASSIAATSSRRSSSNIPSTAEPPSELALSSCQEYEKDGIKYQLHTKAIINEQDGCLKEININGVTYNF